MTEPATSKKDSHAKAQPRLAIKTLMSPITGHSDSLSTHSDLLVAKGLRGRGVNITPTSSRIVAPCDATVIAIASTGHHITLDSNRLIIEIIVGTDAISTHGEGFSQQVKAGDKVKSGQVLVDLDLLKLKSIIAPINLALLVSKGALKLTPYHGTMHAGEDEIIQVIVKKQ